MAAQTSSVSITHLHVASCANLLRVNSAPLFRALMKVLNSMSSSIELRGITVMTSTKQPLITTLTSYAWPFSLVLTHLIIHFSTQTLPGEGCHGRQCQKLYCSQSNHLLLLSLHLPSKSLHCQGPLLWLS